MTSLASSSLRPGATLAPLKKDVMQNSSQSTYSPSSLFFCADDKSLIQHIHTQRFQYIKNMKNDAFLKSESRSSLSDS